MHAFNKHEPCHLWLSGIQRYIKSTVLLPQSSQPTYILKPLRSINKGKKEKVGRLLKRNKKHCFHRCKPYIYMIIKILKISSKVPIVVQIQSF